MGVMLPFVPLARREGELPVGGVECASIGEVVMIILWFVGLVCVSVCIASRLV